MVLQHLWSKLPYTDSQGKNAICGNFPILKLQSTGYVITSKKAGFSQVFWLESQIDLCFKPFCSLPMMFKKTLRLLNWTFHLLEQKIKGNLNAFLSIVKLLFSSFTFKLDRGTAVILEVFFYSEKLLECLWFLASFVQLI